MREIVGLNVGNGWTKAVRGTRSALFESAIAPAVTVQYHSDLRGNGAEFALTCNGSSWFVGEWARLQSDVVISPRARDRDPGYIRVLALAALARVGIMRGAVSVVSGVPVRWYAQDQEMLQEALLGTHRFNVNGADAEVEIAEALIVPEAYGTMFRALLAENGDLVDKGGIRTKTVAIVDVGTFTTNYVRIEAMRYTEHGTDSITVGMARVYDLVRERVAEEHGRELSFRDAEEVARSGSVMVRGEEVDVQRMVAAAKGQVARAILEHAKTLWRDPDEFAVVLATGGGGMAMLPYIQGQYPQTRAVHDAQMANAEGFYRYALRKFGGA